MRGKLMKGIKRIVTCILTASMIVAHPVVETQSAIQLRQGTDYIIKCKFNQKAISIVDDSKENNAEICQMDVTKSASQIWTLEDAGDGYFYIINKNSGKALDIAGGLVENGRGIIQYTRNNGNNQKWKIEATNDGYYKIVPKIAENKTLDVSGYSTEDGGAIIQWTYTGTDNQKWLFEAAESTGGSGDNQQGSLSEQIKNAAYGATVKLDRDYTEQVDILEGDSVVLDLNGHRITSNTNKVIANWGTVKIIDSAGGGIIEIEKRDVDGHVRGIMNEPSAVLTIEGVNIHTCVLEGDPVAIGVHNRGRVLKISDCEIKAETYGTAYTYGIWNEGTIDDISDGWYYGAVLVDHQNGHDSFAVYNNNSGIVNISGGIFVGITRGSGYGYGICSAGTSTANLSGGSFYAVNGQCYKIIDNNTFFEQAVATRNTATINYMNGTSLSANSDGARVVLGENQHYITFVDETELPMATYVMDNNGNIVKRMGNPKESYNVYFKNKTEVVTESDLPRYGSNTIFYVNTGDHREAIYFLGSSVAQGTNSWNNSFADYLGDAYGDQVIIRKRALSGTPIADRDPWSYVKRMEKDINPNAKVDHLVVQLSTNDAGWANSPIGSVAAENEFSKSALNANRETVVGAIEYITAYAQETWGCRVTFWTGPEYNSDKYKEMRSALLEHVYPKWKNHGMGVLDFWTLWKPVEGDINPDGVHPYKQGYLKMVPYTYQYLKEFDAQVVSDYINQIGNVTEEGCSGERIAKARYLYDNMLNDAKQNVSNYQILLDAENKYAAYFEGTREIDNATEVNVLSGPTGAYTENYTELFDGKITTKSGTGNYTTTPYIWKVSSPIAIKYYKLTTANDNYIWKGRNPRDWKLYGSNDYDENGNGTWTEIASVSDDTYLEDENYYEALYKVNSPQRYSYYKWELTNENVGFLQMAEFTMYEDVNASELSVIEGGIQINGYQVNTNIQGMRTIYSVEKKINGLDVVASGIVYGLGDYISTDEMYVGSSNKYVASYDSTSIGVCDKNFSDSFTATSYAMTMKFAVKTAKEFTARWCVRAYAKLSDGSYVYTDIVEYTIYDLADKLYQDGYYSNQTSHDYLYTDILTVVKPDYTKVDFNMNKTLVY